MNITTTLAPVAPTVESLVALVAGSITELANTVTPDATFDELELDSLSMVEIAVIVGQTFGISIQEEEVANSGDFERLAQLVRQRLER